MTDPKTPLQLPEIEGAGKAYAASSKYINECLKGERVPDVTKTAHTHHIQVVTETLEENGKVPEAKEVFDALKEIIKAAKDSRAANIKRGRAANDGPAQR